MSDFKFLKLKDVNFEDKNIMAIHIDTRDFSVFCDQKEDEMSIKYADKNYKKDFCFTIEEVKNIIFRLFQESGGEKKYRLLCLENMSIGWELKYLRFYKIGTKFLACNRNNEPKCKIFWEDKVDIRTVK